MGREHSDGESDIEDRRQMVAKLKLRFPDCSEELILELTYEHHKDIEQITEVLKKNSSHFQANHQGSYFGVNPQDGISYISQEGSYPIRSGHGTPFIMTPYYTLPSGPGYHLRRYNFADDQINPASTYLQRRAISSDRLTSRKADASDIRRERSASDLTNTVMEPSLRAPHGPPYHAFEQTMFAIPQRPQRVDGSSVEHEDDHVMHCIQLQQESLARMETKFKALQNDVARIRLQISQEEQDLNTTLKVQRNPTEKDVEKLKQEIKVLKNEVLKADNKIGSARDPMIMVPEERQPDTFSAQPRTNEFTPASFSTMSRPRFPIPFAGAHLSENIHTHHSEQQATPSVTQSGLLQSSPQNQIGNITDSQENDMWSCSVCTLNNHPFLQECEACGHRRIGLSSSTL